MLKCISRSDQLHVFQSAFQNAGTRSGKLECVLERVKLVRTRFIDGELWHTRLAIHTRERNAHATHTHETHTTHMR